MAGRRIGGAGGGSDKGDGDDKDKKASSAGQVLAGIVLACALAAGGGGIVAGGSSVIGESAAGDALTARRLDGERSARRGHADAAWRRLGLRTLKRAVERQLECVANSTDQVREFLLRTPCTSLDRILFAVGSGGDRAVISVVWIGFASAGDAADFEDVEARQGSGDVRPVAGTVLGLAGVRFSGAHFRSRLRGRTVVIAETESLGGPVAGDTLDALADVASYLPRP